MRLGSFQLNRRTPEVGVVDADVFPLNGSDCPDIATFLSAGVQQWPKPRGSKEKWSRATKYRPGDVTLLAPVMRPGKIIAVGRNYRDHTIETKLEIPTTPNILAKFP